MVLRSCFMMLIDCGKLHQKLIKIVKVHQLEVKLTSVQSIDLMSLGIWASRVVCADISMVKFHVSEMKDARSILFSFVHETSDSIASFFDEIAKEVRIVVLTVD